MKISARNRLEGKVVGAEHGVTTTHVKIDVGGAIVTASITKTSAEELKLAAGKDVYAVIKASDVMVAIDRPSIDTACIGWPMPISFACMYSRCRLWAARGRSTTRSIATLASTTSTTGPHELSG